VTLAALAGGFALDVQGLERLRHSEDRDAALEAAADQFEAVMLQMMLKSLRDATPRAALFDSSATRFHESLLDQQWAQHLAGRGLGLAEQLVAQLRDRPPAPRSGLLAGIPRGAPTDLRGHELPPSPAGVPGGTIAAAPDPLAALRVTGAPRAAPPLPPERHDATTATPVPAAPARFLARLREPAEAAARAAGLSAELMLAQAALETGWGRYRIARADGSDSHNLFGIKAGGDWRGETTSVVTHEYVAGERVRVEARFRVYDSYEMAFADYARLVGGNPRYQAVAAAASAEQAARELQAAGYATDPAYADKLISLIARSRELAESG